MTRGGRRPGAGRPRSEVERAAPYGYRPTLGTVARAHAAGQTLGQRIELALALLDQHEDENEDEVLP